MANATVEDKVEHRVSEMTEGGLELRFILAEFHKVGFEDAESLDLSEVGEPFESVLVLGFVWWRIAQPLDIRRQYFGSFFRNVLAPPLELRFILEPDVVEQMALALRGPCF